ncbi:MAG: hypothetical protein HKP48_05795 [Winogradskyella sp.]|uniref:hypothetical protein n=1 Tax=Winogradskyella sp. TaxID=1883156 RepID=UPI0018500015|nr:hypothetical protein [Winogradskyella sp.]MBT8244729.1 hypothetical protein [Winogradskyella sp.]NNK22809.1 hypothetical protein [Winogradskyella sp.]
MTAKTRKYLLLGFVFFAAFCMYHKFSPYKVLFAGHYDKIWAHRVNSLEKQKSAVMYFDGLELDLVYVQDSNILDVNHPPAESIHLNFDTYIRNLDISEKPSLWLDIKNLTIENDSLIFDRISSVLEKYNCPIDKVLIESLNPEALHRFVKAGFKSSYYVNPKLKKMSESEAENELKYINSVLRNNPKLVLSSNYTDYERLSKAFPNKDLYLWAISSDFNKDFFKIRKLLGDNKVKVVLARYNAFNGNR